MTKKHFEEIANEIKYRAIVVFNGEETYEEKWFALLTLTNLVYELSQTFKRFNENFDSGRFIQATEVLKYKLELEREQATNVATGL